MLSNRTFASIGILLIIIYFSIAVTYLIAFFNDTAARNFLMYMWFMVLIGCMVPPVVRTLFNTTLDRAWLILICLITGVTAILTKNHVVYYSLSAGIFALSIGGLLDTLSYGYKEIRFKRCTAGS